MAINSSLPVTQPKNTGLPVLKFANRFVIYAILVAGCTVTLIPFLWMLLASFKPTGEVLRVPPTFFPEKWTFQSYLTIFTDPKVPLANFYINSIFVSGMRVVITLFTSSLAGFIFAKYKFWGKDIAFGLYLAVMMIPFQIVMIPTYLIIAKLRLIDSLWGLIIPSMVDAFGIYLMRQFIENIPSELMDAARIDGASEFGIYWHIILPNISAGLATLGIFNFMATWNDYLWPLIVITSNQKRTLPLLLTWYNTTHGARYDLSMAASVLVLLPILIVYFIFQRHIIRSMAMTGFK
jgi:ABC-type glycerol-3-phosphate transport system permease component